MAQVGTKSDVGPTGHHLAAAMATRGLGVEMGAPLVKTTVESKHPGCQSGTFVKYLGL